MGKTTMYAPPSVAAGGLRGGFIRNNCCATSAAGRRLARQRMVCERADRLAELGAAIATNYGVARLNSPKRPLGGTARSAYPNRMDVINVSALTKRYGETLAVDDIAFDVAAGTTAGLLGGTGGG